MEIILSTRNSSKAEQIRAVLGGLPISVLTLDDANIKGKAEEDGLTLEENALKKARFAFENANRDIWTMAEDTGLFIEHLNGEPGIFASRWAGEKASTEDILEHTLLTLRGVSNRRAYFETVAAVVTPEGEYVFTGKVSGNLLEEPWTKPQPQMPYSSIFVPEGSELVWAEMTTDQENEISHRGIAFRKVKEFLLEQLEN
jgi:XTP/dITP diphosphohydrolase